MKITIVGGGPGGLYLASLLRERIPETKVTVYERNSPEDTFGFGVVFSEPTLRNLAERDEAGFHALFDGAARWPGIDISIRDQLWRCEGNGFAAIERRRLLNLLSRRAIDAGATLHYRFEVGPGSPELADADLIVVANGANSEWRTSRADQLGATVETASAKFIWFGATKVFDGMTFLFEENEHGWFAVHAYPYSAERSTFVVETDERTWRAAGLDAFDVTQPPGASDEASATYMEKLFAAHLDGGHMVLNNSRWANFRTVRTQNWQIDERTVLLGDAAHTAHFSVGSGTKMAMEDALSLADHVATVTAGGTSLSAALQSYESERRAEVRKIQDVARPSLSWWEHFGEYAEMPPAQFAFHFLTRSGRLGRAKLSRSDPRFLDRALTALLGDPAATVLDRWLPLPGGGVAPTRLVALTAADDPAGVGDGNAAFTVSDPADVRPGSARTVSGGRVGVADHDGRVLDQVLWVCAPERSEQVPDLLQQLAKPLADTDRRTVVLVDVAPASVTNPLTSADAHLAQQRVAEELRLAQGRTVGQVRRDASADEAASLVLAGRADLVAVPADAVARLLQQEATSLAPAGPTGDVSTSDPRPN